jgi:predicted methyltransferase
LTLREEDFSKFNPRKREMKHLLFTALLLIVAPAHADDTTAKLEAAMQAETRSAADMHRDENRMPVETLAFFGLRDDMRVLELFPGGGWYTSLLAPVLRENGELVVALNATSVRDGLLQQPGFDKVKVDSASLDMVDEGPMGASNTAAFDFDADDVDMVLTFRNMHNISSQGRAMINGAVFNSLRSGGLYGIVDHSRRHMAPMTKETRRRADVVQIMKEVLAAGFEFVDYSDLHYRPDDELRYEVGRRSVTGNTDRFTLLFKKP